MTYAAYRDKFDKCFLESVFTAIVDLLGDVGFLSVHLFIFIKVEKSADRGQTGQRADRAAGSQSLAPGRSWWRHVFWGSVEHLKNSI